MTEITPEPSNLPTISLIVAVGRNWVIGAENDLPWRLKADMRHFVETIRGKPVIMGRKTWESFPKRPLPGRANIIVSRNTEFDAPGARVLPSLGTALATGMGVAREQGLDEILVIGGGAVYQSVLDQVDRIYITEVDASPDGDTRFPVLDERKWREVDSRDVPADENNQYDCRIRTLERVSH